MSSNDEFNDITSIEKDYIYQLQQSIPSDHDKFEQFELLAIVREYVTGFNKSTGSYMQMRDALRTLQNINNWRNNVDYYQFLKKRLPDDELYYLYSPEYVYGNDKFGRPLIYVKYEDIQSDNLFAMYEKNEQNMIKLSGQKIALYINHAKQIALSDIVKEKQLYKMSYIIDLEGVGISSLSQKKQTLIKNFFSVGDNYFPENTYKIYILNASYIVKASWNIFSSWFGSAKNKIHFVTSKNIKNILMDDNYDITEIPKLFGGSHLGISTYQLLLKTTNY
jgi:hypothetical protein